MKGAVLILLTISATYSVFAQCATIVQDLLVAFFGAFAGFTLTLCIENKSKKKFSKKKLEYFRTILQKFIEKAEKQTNNIKEFLDNEKNNATNFDCIKRVPTNDINRLKNIDNQHLFESFYNKFGKQMSSTIETYYEITKHIDYLEAIFCIEFPRLENLNAKECYELQKHVKANVENTFWLISAYVRTNNDGLDRELLNEWIEKYHNFIEPKSSDSSTDLLTLESTILEPFLIKIHDTPLLKDPNFQHILLLLKQARTILNKELPCTFEEHKKNLQYIYQSSEESIKVLKSKIKLL